MIASLIFSLHFSSTVSLGTEPISTFMPSPLMTSVAFLVICSEARCGSRSVMTNFGSSGLSPTRTSTVFICPLWHTQTTPRSSSGIAVHWYFLDAAIVMRLEKRHAAVLIERHGADVDARRVEVGGGQAHALGHALFADDGEHDALIRG